MTERFCLEMDTEINGVALAFQKHQCQWHALPFEPPRRTWRIASPPAPNHAPTDQPVGSLLGATAPSAGQRVGSRLLASLVLQHARGSDPACGTFVSCTPVPRRRPDGCRRNTLKMNRLDGSIGRKTLIETVVARCPDESWLCLF